MRLAIELVNDYGSEDVFRVINVMFEDQTHKTSGQRAYAYTDIEEGIRIRNTMMSNDKLTIEKANISDNVCLLDFKVTETKTIEEKKIKFVRKVYNVMNEQLAVVTGLRLYSFFSDMVKLSAHGFFITDENREETYLKVIGTGDDDLIRCLENYLENKDKIDEVTNFHRRAVDTIRKVEEAETEEEIGKAMEYYETFGVY